MTTTRGREPGTVARWIEYRPLADILRAVNNPKRHDVPGIRRSIARFGFGPAPLLDERTGRLVAGHGRLAALEAMRVDGEDPPRYIERDGGDVWLVPLDRGWASTSDAEAEAYLAADNRLTELGGWDNAELAALLRRVRDADAELPAIAGFDDAALARLLADGGVPVGPSLADRFLIPPMDVLDARQGWWRKRKRAWLDVGFASEIGRAGNLVFQGLARADPDYYRTKVGVEQRLGREITVAEFEADHYTRPAGGVSSGTSIFDPVLCELAYRWFCPASGAVLDPFAGGSVRGTVAGLLGYRYAGNDLSADQVSANRAQVADLAARATVPVTPEWSVGDSARWVDTLPAGGFDLLFTCPPYYDLERYSDDPADLSTMTYAEFDAAYARIVAGCARALAPDRFAVIVTGDARDGKGILHDLRGSTIRVAAAAGLALCTGAVLVTPIASAAIMAGRAFVGTRTLGRVHQDVLVFVKGDRGRAAAACGDVEVELPEVIDDE